MRWKWLSPTRPEQGAWLHAPTQQAGEGFSRTDPSMTLGSVAADSRCSRAITDVKRNLEQSRTSSSFASSIGWQSSRSLFFELGPLLQCGAARFLPKSE